MSLRARVLGVGAIALAAAATLVPLGPARADTTIYEIHHVPTVGGATIRVEIFRDTAFDAAKQPVLLMYSPYSTLLEPEPAKDSVGSEWVPKGYARAVADVIGTRGSTGCWDYGGPAEQQAGVDVVKHLAAQPWSNGNVGMMGVSYEGTTATMVAARGDDVPELKAIVPIAAISHWYGYAYSDGVRYLGNSRYPTDEGFDTPLLFDAGFGRTVAADPTGEDFAPTAEARTGECGAVAHTQQGYDRTPDYDGFWQERDYRKDASKMRAAAFVVHGWQDYNVKQEEAIGLYEALPVDDPSTEAVEGVPFKRLWMSQDPHSDGSGPGYAEALDDFLAQTLKGEDRGLALGSTGAVSHGRTTAGVGTWTTSADWPPAGTATTTLHLGRAFDEAVPGVPTGEAGELSPSPQSDGTWIWADTGTSTEEVSLRDPLNRDGHGYYSLFYESPPLAADTRLAGAATLDAWVRPSAGAGAHLTPLLVEVLPDGSLKLVERGFLNLDYRNGRATAQPLNRGQWGHGVVRFLPQDWTFTKGSRIGLILQSSNTVWAVPGNGGTVDVANGPIPGVTAQGTTLQLPLVSAGGLFG